MMLKTLVSACLLNCAEIDADADLEVRVNAEVDNSNGCDGYAMDADQLDDDIVLAELFDADVFDDIHAGADDMHNAVCNID